MLNIRSVFYKNATQSASKPQQAGNVLFAVFGAIALVGVLSASMMTFMKGPLATSIKLTKMNTAESQMTIGAQVAVMATAAQANNGDCDSDGYVEPMEWRAATTEPIPTGGGLVPLSLGISKKDPWGTEYGYCVWNHGPTLSGSGCDANMLDGYNSNANTVVALISAGPDKAFTTTCRDFATADVVANGALTDPTDLPLVSKAAETDDDIITSYTYQEATGASGGLWNLKTGDASTAVINKKIEASGSASFAGGILLPDKSLITCDATTAGIMAKSGTTGIEICDGSAWVAVSGAAAGGGLVLTPNVSTGMDVTGGCGSATCYSSNQTFTLTNNLSPAAASVALVTTLSNTTNFEFVSNNCSGQIIAAGANCMMVVRAKASGNVAYAGQLTITGNNSPFATLDGTASGFAGCNIGGNAPGGLYVGCGISGYNLITTPGGCTNTTSNPTCAGGVDTLTQAGMGAVFSDLGIQTNTTDGLQNTLTQMGYSGGIYSFPAASWCNALDYGGYTDWFLPSATEISSYLYVNRASVGGWIAAGGYMSSTLGNTGNNAAYWVSPTNVLGNTATTPYTVRCMRWDPVKTTTAVVDNTPNTVTFAASYGAAAETRTSNTVSIYGVTNPITVSVSGGTNAQISKNGGAYSAASTTVTNGDQITLQATSPALGNESVVSVTLGTSTLTWQVRTPGTNIIRAFTTSATAGTGALGGVGAADTLCTTRATAAGLPGGWVAVLMGTASGSVETRLPWNWTTLKNMNGATVAVSLNDFMDGTISAPLNYSETGVATASSLVFTGMVSSGAANGTNCGSWTITGAFGKSGDTATTTGGGYFNLGSDINCGGSYRLLCMETNAAGTDLDPNAVNLIPQVSFSSGGTGTSNTVTVTGVTDAVTVTIAPSAGTANIIKNGVSVGAMTTTAGLNETLAFTLTAPTILGTKNTATITIGTDTYTWWVGYADSAKEAKVFVTNIGGGGGVLGGTTGADTYCTNAAAASSYGLSSQWKALLSTSTVGAAYRMPWNWGVLKTVTGVNVVDGGFSDLWDGSLDGPINVNAAGASISAVVGTGTNQYGAPYYPGGTTPNLWCNEWTAGSAVNALIGNSSMTTAGWTNNSTMPCLGGFSFSYIYCIEDVDNAVPDTTPTTFSLPYLVQVPTSSRQTSSAILIGGMSAGATTTMSVTATGGTPTFKVNGGAEVTSASVTNADSIVFLMDAPATDNSYNKMTITAGGTTTYWRVWTGDSTGTAVKRVFITTASYAGNLGGLVGADAKCQAAATGAALGGTWKAILSGITEPEAAINRVGYNWSELRGIDGLTITYAPNLWRTSTTPLINPIVKSQSNVTTLNYAYSNTLETGFNAYTTSVQKNCFNYTAQGSDTYDHTGYSPNTTSAWINGTGPYKTCYDGVKLYCIEQ